MELLNKVVRVYDALFETKEEMFLLGYLMACGGEMSLWNEIEHDLILLEKNPEFWLPIVRDSLRIRREVFNEKVKEVKMLLRRKLEERGAKVPEWLKT